MTKRLHRVLAKERKRNSFIQTKLVKYMQVGLAPE